MNNATQIDGKMILMISSILIIGIFLLLSSIEALVISRFGWVNFSKALGYSFLSNFVSGFLTLILSFGLVFVFILVLAEITTHAVVGSVVNNGVAEPKTPVFEYVVTYLIVVSTIFFLFKRLFLRVFDIKKGVVAWIYALVSSVSTLGMIVGISILFLKYFAF